MICRCLYFLIIPFLWSLTIADVFLWDLPSFEIILFVETLCIVHYSNNLLMQNKENSPNIKTVTFLMKPKLLLRGFAALNFSSIKLKWLAEFLCCVLQLHVRCSDFCCQTIFLEVTSESSTDSLFIPFSPLFKIDCKFLIPQAFFLTFNISSQHLLYRDKNSTFLPKANSHQAVGSITWIVHVSLRDICLQFYGLVTLGNEYFQRSQPSQVTKNSLQSYEKNASIPEAPHLLSSN